jgi:YD repeat-containing protein
MNAASKSRIKTVLRVLTLTAAVVFLLVQIVVRHYEGVVRLKSEVERAKLPLAVDSYPCLLVSRAKPSESLHAVLQQCSPALNNDAEIEQYEVDLRSGIFTLRKTDLFIPDTMPLALTRAYRLWDPHSRAFGIGGNHPYDIFPYGDQFPYTYMELLLGDGTTVHYDRISKGTSFSNFLAEHRGSPNVVFQNSVVGWNVDHWDMKFPDGTIFRFPEAYHAQRGAVSALVGMRNPQGEEIKMVRDAKHNLTSITSPHNHQIRFAYDDSDRMIEASDDAGNILRYSYDQNGRLIEVQENSRMQWRYGYDSTGMSAIQDASERDIVVNQYSRGRIASVTLGENNVYHFNYLVTPRGRVDETMVTDPSGKEVTFRF